MRLPAFLLALSLLAALAFAASLTQRQTPSPAEHHHPTLVNDNYNNSRMWIRAEIRVTPLEQADLNRARLEALRKRVSTAEADSAGLWFSDPTPRKQFLADLELMKELLAFAEEQQANRHKSPTAIQVEHRLNQIQGQMMCEACHSGIVAQNAP